MGDLMRRYWTPALLCSEVPDPDGPPVRVRLLGEDLVAFRDSSGAVGLLEEHCPHRGSSLALAVNERGGLRCLYHGWKWGTDGACLDTPTEPDGSTICKRVKARAYAVRESGGMVWAYLGAPEHIPPFPDFDFLALRAPNCMPYKIIGDCNYAQLVEGTIDSAHAGILHRRVPWDDALQGAVWETTFQARIEVEYTSYGFRYAGIRKSGDNTFHARITAVVYPYTTLIPTEGGPSKSRRLVNVFVPRDDESTWVFQFMFDREQPVDVAYRIEEGGLWIDAQFRKLSNQGNGYQQDRQWMKAGGAMSGIRGILVQDHAAGETQGKIFDRTKEFIGHSDVAVMAWRRQLIKAAKALRDLGTAPPGTHSNIPHGLIRAEVLNMTAGEVWQAKSPLPVGLAPETV
jgi:phenylpropionate dioxygenase-like ring-hydroxylating dioxygenase large terminal subunit